MGNHNIIMAQSVGQGRGLCSRCENFAARRMENGDQRFVCRVEDVPIPIRGIVAECTDFNPKGPGLYGSMAWTLVVDQGTGAITFRDGNYAFWAVEREGKTSKIKRVKNDDE